MRSISLVCLLVLADVSACQELPVPAAPKFEVFFEDGSKVKMTMEQESLVINTEYGTLTVPLARVQRIEFGAHLPEGMAEKVGQEIKRLGNSTYQDRVQAAKYLVEHGRFTYRAARKADKANDSERANRLEAIIREIETKFPASVLAIEEDDCVLAGKQPIYGRIQGGHLKARSQYFGSVALKMTELRCMKSLGQRQQEVVVDAAKYSGEQWFGTEIVLARSMKLLAKAEGSVDMWPQGPGQYMATPKGYNTAGKGGKFMAGALVGRVGEKGEPFLLGEQYHAIPDQDGQLFLQIVASPWNNTSYGTYRVRISAQND